VAKRLAAEQNGGDETAKETAKRLRAYWKEYGGLPFDERMMKVLTDPKSRFEFKRETAENLASFTEDRRFWTTIHPTINGGDPSKKPNPVVVRERRQWAHAIHLLGDPKPVRALAKDFQACKIVVPWV